MQFPTPADLVNEGYGLRTMKEVGSDGTDVFIHGRDYSIIMPPSPGANMATDGGQKTRVFLLLPYMDDAGDRQEYITANRQKLFEGSLLGYPYTVAADQGRVELWRHLPEPYRTGDSGQDYQFNDTRTGSTIKRYDLHATRIAGQVGIGERGQVDVSNPSTWTPDNMTAIYNIDNPGVWNYPYERWKVMAYTVVFERLPYDVMKRTDPAYSGEWSRFLLPQDEPSARAMQIKAGEVYWDADAGYGQPAIVDRVPASQISPTEGIPILLGENTLVWKWLDVPLAAYNWTVIQRYFGTINFPDDTNLPFPSLTPAGGLASPYVQYNTQTLLFSTAHRMQKPNIGGMPTWDLTFYFKSSPGTDGQNAGNWNRLMTIKGFFQRIWRRGGADSSNLYVTKRFEDLFQNLPG